MNKDKSNKIEEAYCVFWVDEKDDDKWEVPQVPFDNEGQIYIGGHGQQKYLYDMEDVNKWIKQHLGNVKGQIGVAKIRKVIKVDLVEQNKC